MPYARPTSLAEALSTLSRSDARVLCGGTDGYAQPGAAPAAAHWLDISGLPALQGIAVDGDMIRIGAATTWLQVAGCAALPALLRQAARTVGSRQVQVLASVGGNLCNAAPAADGVPPLLALDAQVTLAGHGHERRLPVADFILGRRRTALRPGELLTEVRFARPRPQTREGSAFLKFGNREGMTIAVVSAAVRLRWSDAGTVAEARVVVGGASEVPQRLRALEAALQDRAPEALAAACHEAPIAELQPIADLRGSATGRLELARVLVARACEQIHREGHDDRHAR